MDTSKKVSVVMGIYNCADTLREAIDSICSQTYTNWQFIICDDGSVDDSYLVAKEYEKKDPDRFLVIKNKRNRGLNITLNRCLALADGDYIARMDGDDISVPHRFEKEVRFLNRHPEYGLVSSFMYTFDEKGIWGCIRTIRKPQRTDFPKTYPMFCHAPCMIRREVIRSVGGYTEDRRLLRIEDQHLWCKIYAKGYKGYNIQEALYGMRDDREAYTRRTFSNRLNCIYLAFLQIRMLKLPLWMYVYAFRTALMETAKVIMPYRMYLYFHRKRLGVSSAAERKKN